MGSRLIRSNALPLLSFALVLLVATFFVGDIGVYNDDYFCNQRDVVTGEAHDFIMNRPWHLWRPLTRITLTPLVTLLWPHPWALHAIDALLHAGVVALVYALLRRFGVARGIAGAAALAFMVYPVHFEAVLWIDITCTLISTIFVLGVWLLYLRWLRIAHQRSHRDRLGLLLAMSGLAYAAAALNEQPPGALAALPLAGLAIGFSRASSPIRRVVRSAVPVAAVAAALVIYLIGFFHHRSGHPIGGHDPEDMAVLATYNAAELAAKIPGEMLLRDFASGAWNEGVRALTEQPARALIALAGLMVVALWFIGSRRQAAIERPEETPRPRPMAMALLGAAWMVAAWIPVALSHAQTSPRLHYVPAIGLTIIAAALATALPPRFELDSPRSRVLLAGFRAAFACAVGAALVLWIGIQANYQRRYLADQAEIAPLVRAFSATAQPGTFLLPASINSRSATTGSPRFDGYFQPCWEWDFASGWRVQQAMHRPDVYTVVTGDGVLDDGLWVAPSDPARHGLLRARLAHPKPEHLTLALPASADHQGRLIPWDKAVLFRIDGAGHTRIYTRIRLHPPGAAPIEIVPRQVALSPAASTLPELVLDVFPRPDDRYRDPMGPPLPKRASGRHR